MSERPNNFRFIIPLDNLPQRKTTSGSVCNEIIQEFTASDLTYAEVTLSTKSPLTICAYLRKLIKQAGVKNIRVRYIHKRVYLERVNQLTVTTLTDNEKPAAGNRVLKIGDVLEIEYKSVNERNYGLLRLNSQSRWFFPGYKIDFILETDIGEIKSRVTSAMAGTVIGAPNAGTYISGGLREWYRKHPEVVGGKKLAFECLEPYKRYKLTVL
jgi:hypothetical protein